MTEANVKMKKGMMNGTPKNADTKILFKKFGYSRKIVYLCRIGRVACSMWVPARMKSVKRDVLGRLSGRNRNFAKVRTMADRATKRLRSVRHVITPRGTSSPLVRRFPLTYIRWRGLGCVAYPDG